MSTPRQPRPLCVLQVFYSPAFRWMGRGRGEVSAAIVIWQRFPTSPPAGEVFLTPPTEKGLGESRPAWRLWPLEVIAENPRFPHQNLNGPQPGIGFHTPSFPAKAIVVFAAELPQLGHETCILATLNLDERDETGM